MSRLLALILAAGVLLAGAAASADGGADRGTPPSPLPGPREVHYHDDGRIEKTTRIPSGSAFARHGGGRSATCEFYDFYGDPGADPPIPSGTTRESTRWIFVEGNYSLVPYPIDPKAAPPASKGGISEVSRTFSVFCGDGNIRNLVDVITVGPRDPFWNVDSQIATLYQRLQLDRPRVTTEPPDGWPGLVVNNPRALTIDATPWRTYTARATYRGWDLALVADPIELGFTVDVRPKDGDARHRRHRLETTCPSPRAAGALVPSPPPLPDHAMPGHLSLPCVFVPPHRGTAAVTANLTYRVTFSVNGYTEPHPDYAWSSAPRSYPMGEISAVNVLPG